MLKKEIIQTNIMKKVTTPRVKPKQGDYLTDEEMNKILDYLKGQETKASKKALALILYFLNTGLRVGEGSKVKWEDINMDPVTGKGTIRVRHGKTGEGIAYISKDTIAVLQSINPEMKGYLFTGRNGEHISRSTVGTLFWRLYKKLGIKKSPGPHTLRRTFATQLNESGASTVDIQRLLRHKKIDTTLRYIGNNTPHLAEVHEKMNPLAHIIKQTEDLKPALPEIKPIEEPLASIDILSEADKIVENCFGSLHQEGVRVMEEGELKDQSIEKIICAGLFEKVLRRSSEIAHNNEIDRIIDNLGIPLDECYIDNLVELFAGLLVNEAVARV